MERFTSKPSVGHSEDAHVRQYDRLWWTDLADRLLASLRPYASENNARITPPGAEGGYGNAIDGLEGFARSLMIAGFRIAGERGEGVDELIEFYASGIAAGVDPDSPDRWVRPHEHAQAKVECASIALVLDLTRPWIWENFSDRTKAQVIDYLGELVGDDTFPRNNWLWFRIVTETFLRSVGGPWSMEDIESDLALHDSFLRSDGWISDGDERSFDFYTGWALHLYPALWPHMQGATELAAGRREADAARLDRYLLDARKLVGSDGSPLIQGRSLIYRFAAAAPFWAGVLSEVPSTSSGALRYSAGKIVDHFLTNGVPDENGVLNMGWHREWRQLAQSYSGPGSPYWAAKGLLGIMFPSDHPVWNTPAEALPVEQGDFLTAIKAPGWIASGTVADGIVRVTNHGTDHALPGAVSGDSPLYARIGYSTETSPLLDKLAWERPLEQSVAIVDQIGRATHRAGLQTLDVRIDGEVGVAGSTWLAHLVANDRPQNVHGSGISGQSTPVGELTLWSLVRGAWEVRLARVDALESEVDATRLALRIGGWPLAAATRDEITTIGASIKTQQLSSRLLPVLGQADEDISIKSDASPLGSVAVTPLLTFGISVGSWVGALVELTREATDSTCKVTCQEDTDVLTVEVVWPDGLTTSTQLTNSRRASVAQGRIATS